MSPAEFWTHETVRAAVGGSWLARPDRLPALTGGAAIDTRALAPGQVFFALRGEHTDGHRYLGAAFEAGAALAVIDDAGGAGELPPGLPVLRVPNARAALGRLAGAYRATLGSIRAIAVTGSNGKTTTTRMIDACLGTHLRGHCSPKSYNNDLGVPLTILGARYNDQYLLCEVGANAPGEIEPLSRMIRPNIVVITSIGRAHLEGFGSLEGVAAEKASLASHLEPGGAVVLSADAPQLAPWRARFPRVISFGTSADADLRVSAVRQSTAGLAFTLNEQHAYSLPVLGAHNASNAAAAIAAARRLGGPTTRPGGRWRRSRRRTCGWLGRVWRGSRSSTTRTTRTPTRYSRRCGRSARWLRPARGGSRCSGTCWRWAPAALRPTATSRKRSPMSGWPRRRSSSARSPG